MSCESWMDQSASQRPFSPRILTHPAVRILLVLISAALLVCALPKADIGWLGWIALVPLLLACHDAAPLPAAGLGLVTGVTASFGIYGWLFEVPGFDLRHAVVLALYVGAYPAIWCAALAWTRRRAISFLPAAPVLWVAVDYLRAHAGFLALPWGTLAQTQHRNLAILQIASIGGEAAVTLLVAFGNVALACWILRRERQAVLLTGMVLVGVHLWGAARLYAEPAGRTVTVAAIQANIQLHERTTEQGRQNSLDRLERLTRAAAAAQPAVIVWPESAIPGELHADRDLVARLQRIPQETGVPLVVGSAQVEKFTRPEPRMTVERRLFNAAYLVRPEGPLLPPYRKRVLVPFAEYRPHQDVLPWPEWLVPRVTDMSPGDGAQLFQLRDDLAIGPLICWENLFAPLSREAAGNGAQLLVQLTNDVWFGQSAAPHQHNLMSIIRAVENRVPVVIASNAGPSQIIDGYGRIIASTEHTFMEGAIAADIHIGEAGTVYTKTGDLWMCGILLLAAAGLWRGKTKVARVRAEPSPVSLAVRQGIEPVARRSDIPTTKGLTS